MSIESKPLSDKLQEAAAGFARLVKLGLIKHAPPTLKVTMVTAEAALAYRLKRASAKADSMAMARRREKNAKKKSSPEI